MSRPLALVRRVLIQRIKVKFLAENKWLRPKGNASMRGLDNISNLLSYLRMTKAKKPTDCLLSADKVFTYDRSSSLCL